MEIERVDLEDSRVTDAWYEVYARAARFELPYATPWLRCEVPEQFKPSLRNDASAWSGSIAGRVVCVGTIEVPRLDNTHMATLSVYTDPEDRRRGYGSRMLAHLEELARAAGRRTTYAETEYPIDATEDGRGYAGAEFAYANGYAFGVGDVMRRQPLPVETGRLRYLAESAAAHHADYRLAAFPRRVPDAWVADYVSLGARVMSDAPSGTLELEAGSNEVAPFRESELRQERQGRLSYSAIALHEGRAVGYTKVSVARSDRSLGYQWGTLVAAEHRGHRLGLALKVANLLQVQEHEPELRSIVTWNAEVNEPMISVNEQLGYVAVQRGGAFEKRW